MQKILIVLLSVVMSGMLSGCAKKTMSERDVRREQLRLNAHKKRAELQPLAGNYRGTLKDAGSFVQEISLHLELKDMPETEGGQVDPVLVPTITGAMNLTYGTGPGLEQISFGTTKADYNASDSRLDVVVTNSGFSDISLTLVRHGDVLTGSWSSPAASQSGQIDLVRTTELNLGGESKPLGGQYNGLFEWADEGWFALGQLTLTTAQDGIDNFHVTGNMKVTLAGSPRAESFIYEYDTVEFNPLTRQVSVRADGSDLYFIGQYFGGEISGQWFSKRSGVLGAARFTRSALEAPANKITAPAASGTWYGDITATGSSSRLPDKLLLSFNVVPAKDQPGGLALVGSTRFYYGPYSSNEYLEYRFASIDYQPFVGRLVAVTAGTPELTFSIDLASGEISGSIADSSLGQVGTFEAGRDVGADTSIPLAGNYSGIFLHDGISAFQNGKIEVIPTTGDGGLKLSAILTLYMGDAQSSEAFVYNFGEPQFNSVTGAFTLSMPENDLIVRATLRNGEIEGEWFTTTAGKMGPMRLKRDGNVSIPTGSTLLETLKGTYQGTLRNTSSNTNLPERIMFGLITTLDPGAPRGLKITGNLRLYYGTFGSTEFVELPFETLQVDPYRRTISGKTSGSLRLTVSGSIAADNDISGTLSDDALGQVGEFEVTKHVQ